MIEMKDEFLSEEDLDLRNLSRDELVAYWTAGPRSGPDGSAEGEDRRFVGRAPCHTTTRAGRLRLT